MEEIAVDGAAVDEHLAHIAPCAPFDLLLERDPRAVDAALRDARHEGLEEVLPVTIRCDRFHRPRSQSYPTGESPPVPVHFQIQGDSLPARGALPLPPAGDPGRGVLRGDPHGRQDREGGEPRQQCRFDRSDSHGPAGLVLNETPAENECSRESSPKHITAE
jgi:hypothetical protein